LKAAVIKWVGGMVVDDGTVDRIVEGVRARWNYARKRVGAKQVWGLIGIKLRQSS